MSALDPDDPNVRASVFGKQVDDFLKTDIGAYIIERAEHQANAANQKLKRVAPWRTRRIRELQNEIALAESIIVWLADAIHAGNNALEIIKAHHE